jgi:hypothetical protein
MSGFTSRFVLERGIGKDVWRLDAPLLYQSELVGLISVPEGFETDFASIPRFFHRLLPKNGDYDAAAVVHDWLYATGDFSKDTADRVFLEAMKCLGVSAWKRTSMYQAVNLFGFAAWNGHRRRQESNVNHS